VRDNERLLEKDEKGRSLILMNTHLQDKNVSVVGCSQSLDARLITSGQATAAEDPYLLVSAQLKPIFHQTIDSRSNGFQAPSESVMLPRSDGRLAC
jgi:hypothetical protein